MLAKAAAAPGPGAALARPALGRAHCSHGVLPDPRRRFARGRVRRVGSRSGGAAVSDWASLAIAVAAVLALAAVWRWVAGRRRADGASLASFLRHFDALHVPDEVALRVHHHLEQWMADAGQAFPVGPRDPLSRYGIGPEDVDEALDLLLGASGSSAGSARGRPPIETVEDLVRCVAGHGCGAGPLPREKAGGR